MSKEAKEKDKDKKDKLSAGGEKDRDKNKRSSSSSVAVPASTSSGSSPLSATASSQNLKVGEPAAVAKQTKAWSADMTVAVEQFRAAYSEEALQHATTKAELERLRHSHEALKAELKTETQQHEKAQAELASLRDALSSTPEAQQRLFRDTEQLRRSLETAAAELRGVREQLRGAQESAERERESAGARARQLDRELEAALAQRRSFEQRCAQLQLAKLDQRFADKSREAVLEETRQIFRKSLELVAVHKDLPRLYKALEITDMDANIIYQFDPKESQEQNLQRVITQGCRRLDNDELAKKVAAHWGSLVDPQKDLIKGLGRLLVDVCTDRSRFAQVMKAANQSVIAAVFGVVQDGLAGVLPFTAAKGQPPAGSGVPAASRQHAWRISILIAPTAIRVTHVKREQSAPESEELYGRFEFEWSVELVLAADASELVSFDVQLQALHAEQARHAEHVRTLLARVFNRLADPQQADRAQAGVIHIATLDSPRKK